MVGTGLGGVLGAGLMSGVGPGGGPGGYGYGGYWAGGYGAGGYGAGGYGAGGYGAGGYGGPFGGGPGGFADLGGYWAFRALGAAGGGGGQPALTPRADVRRGLLTPETEDLAALTVSGEDPSVLAFALLSPAGGGDPVCYTVLNLPEPASYAYRAAGPDPGVLVNQALDDAGFAPAGVHAVAAGDLTAARRRDAAGSPLAGALAAVITHDEHWAEQVARLLGC